MCICVCIRKLIFVLEFTRAGDDTTDEDVFRVMNGSHSAQDETPSKQGNDDGCSVEELEHIKCTGFSVLVRDGAGSQCVATAAQHWIANPEEVCSLLRMIREGLVSRSHERC